MYFLKVSGQTNNEICKNFKEVVMYLKGREEKVSMVETKLKQSEIERKKLQNN